MQYNKKSVEDIDVSGKKVIARCDFNVPQDENGNITDDKRIRASLETIKYLLDHNAAVILCSHLGRPKGEVNMKYSLAPVAKRLSELLGQEVKLAKDVVGEDAKKLAAEVKPGEAILLENVRFEKGETKNDPALAKAFTDMADIFVNDAFGTAHRAHCLLYTSNGDEERKAAVAHLSSSFFHSSFSIFIRGRTLCRNIKNPGRSLSVTLTACIWAIRR